MGARDNELVRVEAFTGTNNLARENALKPSVLREAVDVVLDRAGKLRSRGGYGPPVVACVNGHSLWSDKRLGFALFADEATLGVMHRDESSAVLRGGLSPGLPVSYALVNDAVLWSNGVQRGMVTVDLELHDWACPTPYGQPQVSALATGRLPPGQVKVCVTWVDVRGRESGGLLSGTVLLDTIGGVQIDAIPQPPDPAEIPFVRVYLATGNDKVLYLARQLPAGLTSYTALAPPEGRQIATQSLQPLPAGHIVRHWNGRQLVARGRTLYWSPALRYGLYHPARQYLRFHSRIDVLEPIGDGTDLAGVFVVAGDTTYYLTGADPKDWKQSIPYPYGAVPDSASQTPASAWGIQSKTAVPAWMGRNGLIVVGLPGGSVTTFKDSEAVAGIGERGASVFMEADGIRQFLVSLRGHATPRLAVGDHAIARVYDEAGNLKP